MTDGLGQTTLVGNVEYEVNVVDRPSAFTTGVPLVKSVVCEFDPVVGDCVEPVGCNSPVVEVDDNELEPIAVIDVAAASGVLVFTEGGVVDERLCVAEVGTILGIVEELEVTNVELDI